LVHPLYVKLDNPGVVGIGIFTIVLVISCLTLLAFSPALREWSSRRRKIVVDDAGLWLWKYGEMMRWPDLQLLEGQKGELTAIWNQRRLNIIGGTFSISSGDGFFSISSGVRDHEGNRWSEDTLENLIRAYWARSRDTSAVRKS
jgi:hypothetical protein